MSRRLRRTMIVVAALAIGVALVDGAAARGGGGRGGGGGGGGRGGAAARGSFGQNRPAGGMVHNAYNARGPAAGGDFGWERRHERREERRERRDDEPVIYYDDYYDDYDAGDGYDSYDDGAAYDEGEPGEGDYDEAESGQADYNAGSYDGDVYDELPCQAAVVVMHDTAYYVCDGVWYVRAYSDGELVYVEVPAPSE